MPDRGNVMSQAYYEKQTKLYQLYHESFGRKEINTMEAIAALRVLGFSDSIAIRRVNEWEGQSISYASETGKAKNRRLKQQASLERYVLYMRLGKKYYIHLKSEYRDKKLSKEKIVSILMQSKHSRELSESIVEKWDKEK